MRHEHAKEAWSPCRASPAGQGYLRASEAAEYIGYSVRHFRRLVEQYSIPAFGPELNRFKPADLDTFMENPHAFISSRHVRPNRRRGGFTPVTV